MQIKIDLLLYKLVLYNWFHFLTVGLHYKTIFRSGYCMTQNRGLWHYFQSLKNKPKNK